MMLSSLGIAWRGIAIVMTLVLMMVMQGCASGMGVVTAGGLEAALSDEALSDRAPVIVVGLVTSKSVVRFVDDPFLPAGWESDEELARMVEGGAGNVKYGVNVTSTTKGATAARIWVVRGSVGASVAVEGAGPPATGADPEPGLDYRMWLEPFEWFGQEHYVLVRAREVVRPG